MERRPVIVANPGAGRSGLSLERLREAFPEADVRDTGDDLRGALHEAFADGPAWLGVSGGDGSIRCAAGCLPEGLPLLVLPGGTRNSFAKTVGCATLEDAVRALEGGRIEPVDLGCVGDEVFLNTSSIGLYASVVRERTRRRDKLPKRVADVVGAWQQVRHGKPMRVRVDDRAFRAWAVFVGNGAYGDGLLDLRRDSLPDGELDIAVLLAQDRFSRLRYLGAAIAGRLSAARSIERWQAPAASVSVLGRDLVDLALDGDVLRVHPDLEWSVRRRALPVFVGPGVSL